MPLNLPQHLVNADYLKKARRKRNQFDYFQERWGNRLIKSDFWHWTYFLQTDKKENERCKMSFLFHFVNVYIFQTGIDCNILKKHHKSNLICPRMRLECTFHIFMWLKIKYSTYVWIRSDMQQYLLSLNELKKEYIVEYVLITILVL